MPKLPVGMHKRKGREGYWLRLYRGGRERRVFLANDYNAALEECEKARARAGVMPTSRVTVAESATLWLETYVRTQRAEQGQRIAQQRVRDYLVPFMGQMLLDRVEREDARGYRMWLERTTKLSPCTIWHVLSDYRCLLSWAENAGLVERSPFPRRVMPRLEDRPPDRVTDEEADRLRALPDPYGFVCRLALGVIGHAKFPTCGH